MSHDNNRPKKNSTEKKGGKRADSTKNSSVLTTRSPCIKRPDAASKELSVKTQQKERRERTKRETKGSYQKGNASTEQRKKEQRHRSKSKAEKEKVSEDTKQEAKTATNAGNETGAATLPRTEKAPRDVHVVIKIQLEQAPEVGFDSAVHRSKWDKIVRSQQRLLSSHMMSESSTSTQYQQPEYGYDIELGASDFSSIVTINVFESVFRIWTNAYFGMNPKSAPCRMLVDTGSSYTWVNERIYRQKCLQVGATLGEVVGKAKFKYDMEGGTVEIYGTLHKNVISFSPEDTAVRIPDQVIALIEDSSDQPVVRRWREDLHVIGILGIGPTEATRMTVVGYPNRRVKTVVHNLLGSEAGVVGLSISRGELSIGSSPNPNMIWCPTNKKWGRVHQYVVDMKLAYQGVTFTEAYPVLMDTGTPFINVPKRVMTDYIHSIESAGKIKVEWDSAVQTYYTPKGADLKSLVFEFGNKDSILFVNQVISGTEFQR